MIPFAYRSRASLAAGLGFCAASLLWPALAQAQSITIVQSQSLPRVDADGNVVQKRPLALNPEGINLQDCRDDLRIRFPLALSGFQQNDTIEVWASDQGTNCADPVNRSSATALCYKLEQLAQLSPTPTITVPVKEIIRGRADTTQADSDGCRRLNQGTITIQFLYFRGAPTGQPAQKVDIPLRVDTQGPTPLTGVRVLPGNQRFTISWDAIGEGGVADIIGVRAYCLPNPTAGTGTGTGGEAGTIEVCDPVEAGDEAGEAGDVDANCRLVEIEAGTGTGGSVPDPSQIPAGGAQCSAAEFEDPSGERLVPSQEFADKFECGSITGVTGSSVGADSVGGAPLVNGTVYAVAVAATDSFGNIGELSDVYCQYPERTTDFWRDYKAAGGDAGGGCSVEGTEAPIGSLSVTAIAFALTFSTLRRRRKSR